MPNASLACLYSSLSVLLMPPPKVMLYPETQTVVDDLTSEGKKDRRYQPGQGRADDFLQRIGQAEDAIGFVRRTAAGQEDGVLLQIAEDVELAGRACFQELTISKSSA